MLASLLSALAYAGFHPFPEWDGSSIELPSMHCPNFACFKYLVLSNWAADA